MKEFFKDEFRRLFPNWRHAAIKIPLILIGLYLMIFEVLHYTSTTQFCTICKSEAFAKKTTEKSSHRNLECGDCHTPHTFFGKTYQKITVLPDIIPELTGHYEIPKIPKKPLNFRITDESCTDCHSPETRKFTLSGDLIMDHVEHSKIHPMKPLEIVVAGEHTATITFVGNEECIYCHFNVAHSADEENYRPRMNFCMRNCHNNEIAPDKCDLCHTNKPLPANHRAKDWYEVHGERAKTEDCVKCHGWVEDFCSECHKKRPKSHDKAWRSTHKKEAKQDPSGCAACHEAKFCLKCHGISPLEGIQRPKVSPP
ncbi:MAG: NapC/NirT family cytochrome c, partial [Actinobacteria bacterium]|nr:NapC/NirT family cytochrome c [Actinomycetota bacterium]